MSGLEFIVTTPMTKFYENRLPTLEDVLRFYAQFWGKRMSDSKKEKFVAQELIKLYEQQSILVFSEKTIKNKINKNVANLKTILKFKTKTKTAANVERESTFRSGLSNIFEIRRPIQILDECESENEGSADGRLADGIYSTMTGIYALELLNRLKLRSNIYVIFT